VSDNKLLLSEAYAPLSGALGHVVLGWSFIETSFSHWIATIYKPLRADKIEREIPIQFKRKTKFLKRCFNQVTPLNAFRDEALDLINVAHQLNDHRNFLLHGVLSTYDRQDHEFKFVRLNVPKHDRQMHYAETRTYTIEKILEIGGECHETSTKCIDLSERLINEIIL